jgi:hypothetical protein
MLNQDMGSPVPQLQNGDESSILYPSISLLNPNRVITYQGQPVFTFHMIDTLHYLSMGWTSRDIFCAYKNRFRQGKDYLYLPYEEWSQINIIKDLPRYSNHRNIMIFLTRRGYLIMTKLFNDGRSWRIQRAMANNYIRNLTKNLSIENI